MNNSIAKSIQWHGLWVQYPWKLIKHNLIYPSEIYHAIKSQEKQITMVGLQGKSNPDGKT